MTKRSTDGIDDSRLVGENRFKLIWINEIDRRGLAKAFERQGWCVLRIDASKLRTADELAVAFAGHIRNGPEWMRADADGLQYWFLYLFESLGCTRLCVVVDRGRQAAAMQDQDLIISTILNDLRQTRETLGERFTDGTRGVWELAVLWISTAGARPALPANLSDVQLSLAP